MAHGQDLRIGDEMSIQEALKIQVDEGNYDGIIAIGVQNERYHLVGVGNVPLFLAAHAVLIKALKMCHEDERGILAESVCKSALEAVQNESRSSSVEKTDSEE